MNDSGKAALDGCHNIASRNAAGENFVSLTDFALLVLTGLSMAVANMLMKAGIGAVLFFHERISFQKLAGLGAIVLGIFAVARG